MNMDDFYSFRESLVRDLERDLIGPSLESEEIEDPPLTHYLSGILYPQSGDSIDPALDTDMADEDDESHEMDLPIALSNVRYPSSMGLTFAVDIGATTELHVLVQAARYEPIATESPADAEVSASPKWRRMVCDVSPVTVDVGDTKVQRIDLSTPGLGLYIRVRDPDDRNAAAVTVVLVNLNSYDPRTESSRDLGAFLQCGVEVRSATAQDAVFVSRTSMGEGSFDEEDDAFHLLHRDALTFAVGHGCAADWEAGELGSERARRVWSTFCPKYDVNQMDSGADAESEVLDMRWLADSPRDEVVRSLSVFCSTYEDWIAGQTDALSQLTGDRMRKAGEANLDQCRRAVARMRSGVKLLSAGSDFENHAWQAFMLMNRAMREQRARSTWIRNGAQGAGPDPSTPASWRPFQLGFILLCMESIVNTESPDRESADLLWFPTGGGKTEAYLALIAFTVFLRRLRCENGGGVTAIMRYTLRLLTLQQFERATSLICCCEDIRRSEPLLGEETISIGLWLGRDATPNTRSECAHSLDQLRAGTELRTQNPVQLRICPWCGSPLTHANYTLDRNDERLVVRCNRTQNCAFAAGLPIHIVDDDIYRYRPTLVIATVDKFASVAWREDACSLFNLDGDAAETPPPELIVQDELHLISGPLGTLVGLYEAGIERACTRDGLRPKVVASTATIRSAASQVKALFNRSVCQFPPPGLDARDSFFATQAPRSTKATRLYAGLLAPGTSQSTLLIRTYARLLQSVGVASEQPEVLDPYWTLVGYFNSLRVLGAAQLQVQDDVGNRVSLLANRSGEKPRVFDERIELTSQESSSAIPEHLKRMEIKLGDSARRPLDVIAATNMISVGVDVDRLGLMVVMGQPHATAEYIQSTSRIGRRYPGLVVTLYNSAKSRDRSHYEAFRSYHSALYRQVESSSVTPFSARARDRGLHAVLVALVRILIPDLRANAAASNVDEYRPRIGEIIDEICSRVTDIAPDEEQSSRTQMNRFLEQWIAASKRGEISYRASKKQDHPLLGEAADLGLGTGPPYPTLWSLREVDKESKLFLI